MPTREDYIRDNYDAFKQAYDFLNRCIRLDVLDEETVADYYKIMELLGYAQDACYIGDEDDS